MIARIDLTADGPAVSGRVGSGRRAVVIVSEELCTPVDPRDWPDRMDPVELLAARCGSDARYIRRQVAEAARTWFPGGRLWLVPRGLLPGRRRSGSRALRARSLRARRFRAHGGGRSVATTRAAATLLVLACAAAIAVAERSTSASQRTIEAAAGIAARRQEAVSRLEVGLPQAPNSAMADDPIRTGFHTPLNERPSLPVGPVIDAVIARLHPAEAVHTLHIAADTLSLSVQTLRVDLTDRLATIDGISVTGETLTRTASGYLATVTARIGASR